MSLSLDDPLCGRDVNTYDVGEIVSYDPVKRRATVRPLPKTRRFDDDNDAAIDTDQGVIDDVPVLFLGSPRVAIAWDVQPGDPCEIQYGKHNLAAWKQSGGTQVGPVVEERPFQLHNAVCRVGVFHSADDLPLPPTKGIAMVARDQSAGDFRVEMDLANLAVMVAAPKLVRVKSTRIEIDADDVFIRGRRVLTSTEPIR